MTCVGCVAGYSGAVTSVLSLKGQNNDNARRLHQVSRHKAMFHSTFCRLEGKSHTVCLSVDSSEAHCGRQCGTCLQGKSIVQVQMCVVA